MSAASAALAADAEEEVERLQDAAGSTWDGVVAALPRVGIALLLVAFFLVLGRVVRPIVRRRLELHRTPSFAQVFARITQSGLTVLGALLAITVVFPSVRPVDLLAGAGVISVAVGFAFQDILQNLLAGVLLLFRQPFRGGDQIEVGDVQGTVQEINIRETVVTTFDGRRVLIPNAKVYTDIIRVQTVSTPIRTSFVVGIAYESDLATARRIAVEALLGIEGVVREPAPEALYLSLGTSTVDLDVRFWSDPHQLETRRTLDRAIEAVKVAFDEAGIEMPAQIVALQATSSLAAMLRGGEVTPGGSVAAPPGASADGLGGTTPS